LGKTKDERINVRKKQNKERNKTKKKRKKKEKKEAKKWKRNEERKKCKLLDKSREALGRQVKIGQKYKKI